MFSGHVPSTLDGLSPANTNPYDYNYPSDRPFALNHPGSNLPADMVVEGLPPDIILRKQFAKKLLNDWQAAAQVTKSAQFV
jgi:hypothetical protein